MGRIYPTFNRSQFYCRWYARAHSRVCKVDFEPPNASCVDACELSHQHCKLLQCPVSFFVPLSSFSLCLSLSLSPLYVFALSVLNQNRIPFRLLTRPRGSSYPYFQDKFFSDGLSPLQICRVMAFLPSIVRQYNLFHEEKIWFLGEAGLCCNLFCGPASRGQY